MDHHSVGFIQRQNGIVTILCAMLAALAKHVSLSAILADITL